MSDQPKPTQEWTEGRLRDYVAYEGYAGMLEAINADLAAERKKREADIKAYRESNLDMMEKLNTAVEALKMYSVTHDKGEVAKVALARIGGK